MQFIYPAVFTPHKDGRWTGFFPDLTGCTVEGDSLDEAVDRAIEAAYEWLSVELFEEEDPRLPMITSPEDMELKKKDVVRNIGVNIRFHTGYDE